MAKEPKGLLNALATGVEQTLQDEALRRINQTRSLQEMVSLDPHQFRYVANWYYWATVELIEINPRISSIELSEKLQITETVAEESLEVLQRLGIIVQKENHGWSLTAARRKIYTGAPSESIKRAHLSVMQKAQEALRLHSMEKRDFMSAILKFNCEHMEEAKQRIASFEKEFNAWARSLEEADRVYALGIQFFALSEQEPKPNS